MTIRTEGRPFTGRHMVLVMLAFFGTIISVNLIMASFARSSWTGLVVQNSYVASQQFNEKMAESRALAKLGWRGVLETESGRVVYRLNGRDGRPVAATGGKAIFRHPAAEGADWSAGLKPVEAGVLAADVDVADGVWAVELEVEAGLDRPYRQMIRVLVKNGVVQ